MVQLGRHYGAGPASLAEIAAEEELPRPYLEQLVMSLRDAGLVVSTRGARGGYELTRRPADIAMADVLRALEGPIAPMICATEDDPRPRARLRPDRPVLGQPALGPDPRRDQRHARRDDPGRARPGAHRAGRPAAHGPSLPRPSNRSASDDRRRQPRSPAHP